MICKDVGNFETYNGHIKRRGSSNLGSWERLVCWFIYQKQAMTDPHVELTMNNGKYTKIIIIIIIIIIIFIIICL